QGEIDPAIVAPPRPAVGQERLGQVRGRLDSLAHVETGFEGGPRLELRAQGVVDLPEHALGSAFLEGRKILPRGVERLPSAGQGRIRPAGLHVQLCNAYVA